VNALAAVAAAAVDADDVVGRAGAVEGEVVQLQKRGDHAKVALRKQWVVVVVGGDCPGELVAAERMAAEASLKLEQADELEAGTRAAMMVQQ
jgi:hypothetical protein